MKRRRRKVKIKKTEDGLKIGPLTARLLTMDKIYAETARLKSDSDQFLASVLSQRGTTHGDFKASATFAQHLRACWREAPSWHGHNGKVLTDAQRQALDEIAIKIARILYGDPQFQDHWRDLSGYSKLGEDACTKVS